MRLPLNDIARAVGAALPLVDATASGVTMDSRCAAPGQLFVCIPGQRVDGHDFAVQAQAQGAVAILAEREVPGLSIPVLRVASTRQALLDLGRHWRGTLVGRLVAVTGSAGKTTVKELLAQVLATSMKVAWNHKNLNNQIGLPLSLLAAEGDERALVMELGVSRPGDMDELAPVAAPDVALIHNVGPAHLEALGSVAGVAAEKCKLLAHLRPGGQAAVNMDYPELWAAARAVQPMVLSMSTRDESADYYCTCLDCSDGMGRFRMLHHGLTMECGLPGFGAYQAENLAAVMAGVSLLGLSMDILIEGLLNVRLPDQRFAVCELGPHLLIDDSYNANPLSMGRAVEAARAMASGRSLVLVLGDMGELGPCAEAEHEALGRKAAEAGAAAVFHRGRQVEAVRRGLEQGGYTGEFSGLDAAADLGGLMAGLDIAAGVFLVKGSRSARMEECAGELRELLGGGRS